MQRLQNVKNNASVGLLDCIFIALPKIGSLCSLRVPVCFSILLLCWPSKMRRYEGTFLTLRC